jgi:hypothetical protein
MILASCSTSPKLSDAQELDDAIQLQALRRLKPGASSGTVVTTFKVRRPPRNVSGNLRLQTFMAISYKRVNN